MLGLAEIRWAALSTVLFVVGGLTQLAGAPAAVWWTAYLARYAAGGWEPALAGIRALQNKTLDVDLLMIVAALVAAAIGLVFDGALLIVIFATSGALEALATRRTADSVRALLDLTPQRATRLREDGHEELVDTADLTVGDRVLVRPGELIGADALVADGTSEVDQASVTGEPLPVLKQRGDEVFAGTLNGTGALTVEVHRPAAESVLARIVALVQEASASKARTQLFIEKIEQRYSVGVVAATLALFAVPLLAGAALQPTLLRAMTFMIVASPCAVVLATMPPLLSAIANAGRHGLLVKSAVVMEQLALTDIVAFDKTGTLTEGTTRLAAVHLLPDAGCDETELLTLAAAAEHPSEHPIAGAVVAAARARGLHLPPAEEFDSAPGRGVTATVNGHQIRIGSPSRLAGEADAPDRQHAAPAATAQAVITQNVITQNVTAQNAIAQAVAAAEADGRTAVLVLIDGRAAGVLSLADRHRSDAARTVRDLTVLTGNRPVLLTGDNTGAATALAADMGITEVHAGLLPADKAAHVNRLQAEHGRRVLLVGDGVNDAPALATADIGVAMGRHGSDLALETADAVIVRDDLATLPTVIELSRRARRVVIANLVIAGAVITGLVTWDLVGHLPLPLGVAGHEGSTVIVGLNGLRLLRTAAWGRSSR